MLDAQSDTTVSFTIHAQAEPEIEMLRFEPDNELKEMVSEIIDEQEPQDNDQSSEEEK